MLHPIEIRITSPAPCKASGYTNAANPSYKIISNTTNNENIALMRIRSTVRRVTIIINNKKSMKEEKCG